MARKKSTEVVVPRQHLVAAVGDRMLTDTGGLVYNSDVAGEGIKAVGGRGALRYLDTLEVLTEAADNSPNLSSGVAREGVLPFIAVTREGLLADVADTQARILAAKRSADSELFR